jgi:metal-responsive CopG/Arc/MetJ family transcriptional regulator
MLYEEKAHPESDKTVLVSIRVPQSLLDRFDAVIRERAYREGKRVTRNSAIVELIGSVVQEQQQDGGKANEAV